MTIQKSDYQVTVEREKGDAFSKRVKAIAREFGGVPNLARACDISDSVVRKWIKGQSEPSRLMLIKLGLNAGVRFDWLVLGVGPMHTDEAMQVGDDVGVYTVQARDNYLVALQMLEEVLQGANVDLTPSKKVQAVEIIAGMIERNESASIKSNIHQLIKLAS